MDKIKIRGGRVLEGEVVASGSKNATLPLLFSTLLASGKHTFYNIPKVKDVETSCLLLKNFGCQIQKEEPHTLHIMVPEKMKSFQAHYHLMKTMRAGILSLGPLLARYGQAQISLPGGCAIGSRPVNWHIENLKKLGATIQLKTGYIVGHQKTPLIGSTLHFKKPSVGGTQNLMMAASLAQGMTTIHEAAKEPEVVELASYINQMGGKIQGAGTSKIRIEGVTRLHPSCYRIVSDRIEVATLLIASAITKGHIRVNQCHPHHLSEVLFKLKETGATITTGEDWIEISYQKPFQAVSLKTAPYPGFPTDIQAQWMALMTQAQGVSQMKECIFENRFMHVPELNRLNANITIQKDTAFIHGPSHLQGAFVTATDLRASSCLVLAGLIATGETVVQRVYHLDRGYEKLENKLSLIGADIQRL